MPVSPIFIRVSTARSNRSAETKMGSYRKPNPRCPLVPLQIWVRSVWFPSFAGVLGILAHVAAAPCLAGMVTRVVEPSTTKARSSAISFQFQLFPSLTFAPENRPSEFSTVSISRSVTPVNSRPWQAIRQPNGFVRKTQPKMSFGATTNLGSVRLFSLFGGAS
jgi:hypothetical protein